LGRGIIVVHQPITSAPQYGRIGAETPARLGK
jgi:hypothetical protein